MAVWSSSSIRSLGRFSASKGTPAEASSTTKRWADCLVVPWDTSHHVGRTPRPGSTSAPAAGAGGGDAEIAFQHRAIAGKIGARSLVDHRAALDDRHPVGHAEHFLGVLLDQDRRHAFIA